MFFLLSLVLSSIGAGNIAGTALMAPLAMLMAYRVGIPAFLMAIMVAHGCPRRSASPLAPTGIIADKLMQKELGLSNFEIKLYLYNLAANAFVGVAGYLLFGGWRLFGRKYVDESSVKPASADMRTDEGWSWKQFATLVVIGSLIIGVIFFRVMLGWGRSRGLCC